jgi:hypothetical protein
MQLSQQARFSGHASDALKALAYLILDLQRKHTVNEITNVVAKAISLATKRMWKELEDVVGNITAETVSSTNAAEGLHGEC